MRLKLFLSFTLIVLISVSLVAIIVRWGAVNEVRAFMFRGGMYGISDLASNLEEYYQGKNTWNGVNSVFTTPRSGMMPGMGMMMDPHMLLSDATGSVIEDTQGVAIEEQLSRSEMDVAHPIGCQWTDSGLSLCGGWNRVERWK